MKNLYKIFSYSLAMTLVFFAACDSPLQDEIDEIEESTAIVKDIEYTLTDDDYGTIDDECECTGFGSFNSEDDAKEFIPVALNDVFPALGSGSTSITTYLLFNGSSPDLNGDHSTLTVEESDYTAMGFTYPNFGNPDEDVVAFVNYKGIEGEDGDYIDVTFDYYDGSFHGGEVSRIAYTVAYGWQYVWIAPQEVYDFFGESSTEFPDGSDNYTPDFSYDDEAEEVMHIYLDEYMSVFAEDGDILVVQFNYDNNTEEDDVNPTEMDLLMYIYNGSNWILYGDGYQTTAQTLSFGNDGSTWVPDNTIKYTLGSSDYAAIGAAWASKNPDGSASISQYSNYDLTLWSDDQIVESLNEQMLASSSFLKEVDQKYLVSYAVWMPGAGTGSKLFIYDGTNFVIVEEE